MKEYLSVNKQKLLDFFGSGDELLESLLESIYITAYNNWIKSDEDRTEEDEEIMLDSLTILTYIIN